MIQSPRTKVSCIFFRQPIKLYRHLAALGTGKCQTELNFDCSIIKKKKQNSFIIIIFQNRKSKIHLLNSFFGSWYLTFQSVKRTPCQSYTSVSPQCLHALLSLRAQGLWYQQWLPAVGELCLRKQNNGSDSPLYWHSESCSFIHSQDSANGWVLLSTLCSLLKRFVLS